MDDLNPLRVVFALEEKEEKEGWVLIYMYHGFIPMYSKNGKSER